MTAAAGLTRPPDRLVTAAGRGGWARDRTLFLAALPAPAILVVAVMIGNGTLAMGAAGLALAIALVSPVSGLTMVALVAPLITQPILPYPGLNALLLATTILGSIIRLPIERPRISLGLPVLAVFAFLLYIFVQQLPAMFAAYAGEHEATGSYFLRHLTAVMAVVAAALALNGRSPYPVMAGFLVSAVVVVGLAIMTFDGGQAGPLLGNLLGRADERARPSGPFWNPNYYGWYTSSMLLLVLGLLAEFRGALRWALGGLAVFLALGVAISLSRGAFVSLMAGIIALGFARGRRTGAAMLVVAAVCAVTLLPFLIDWRLTGGEGAASGQDLAELGNSDQGRLAAVLEGPRLFLSSPFFGHGLGSYGDLAGVSPHNWYMAVLAELGFVGAVLVGIVLLSTMVSLRKVPRLPRSIGIALLVQLLVNSLFLRPPGETQASIPIALMITAALVADWHLRGTHRHGHLDTCETAHPLTRVP